MVQLHAYHAGLQPPRATTDVDLLIHVEIDMTWSKAKSSSVPAGFELRRPSSRYGSMHRFVRPNSESGVDEVVDVMIADHVAPSVLEKCTDRAHLVQVPGGTSALRKTINCRITTVHTDDLIVSVPNVLGALTLKGGAYAADSRDQQRHLEDAVVLLATVEDADEIVEDVEQWTRHDSSRLKTLHQALSDAHDAWQLIREPPRRMRAQESLKILAAGPAQLEHGQVPSRSGSGYLSVPKLLQRSDGAFHCSDISRALPAHKTVSNPWVDQERPVGSAASGEGTGVLHQGVLSAHRDHDGVEP